MEQFITDRNIAGINYTIRELTVSDIRNWLKDMEQMAGTPDKTVQGWLRKILARLGLASQPIPASQRDAVDVMLFDGFVMFDLMFLTSLKPEQITTFTPAQIRGVWAACEEINADFFALRRRLELVGMASPEMSAEISKMRSRN